MFTKLKPANGELCMCAGNMHYPPNGLTQSRFQTGLPVLFCNERLMSVWPNSKMMNKVQALKREFGPEVIGFRLVFIEQIIEPLQRTVCKIIFHCFVRRCGLSTRRYGWHRDPTKSFR